MTLTTKFPGKVAFETGTAAGEGVNKAQFDTGIADAKNLANATGTLDPARIADGTVPTGKISGFQSAVDARVQTIVDASSTALDTFREFATAINNDPAFSATINALITSVANRVTALENAGSAPTQYPVPVIAGGSTGTITHNKNRRVIACVIEVSTGQEVGGVVTANNVDNTITLDFGSAGAANGQYVALVL